MNAPRSLRRGWCPGALRPMQSGDGLIVRVRPHGGILCANDLRVLAMAARMYGNGLIELTRRASVQLRGVREETMLALHRVLDRLNLLDKTPSAEMSRNILASPLAGLDPGCRDIRRTVNTLAHALRATCINLSPKFGFLIDGGGMLRLSSEEADVRFEADHMLFRVSVGGTSASASVLGRCTEKRIPQIAVRLAALTMGLRMKDFIARNGTAALIKAIANLLTQGAPADLCEPVAVKLPIGAGPGWIGLAVPFGAITSEQFGALANLAERFGTGEIRITPWRGLIVVLNDGTDRNVALVAACAAGFIADANDARLSLAACPGAPACRSAQGKTRELALEIARTISAHNSIAPSVHVSGCRKSCARSEKADVVLMAEKGRYRIGFETTIAEIGNRTLYTAEEAIALISAHNGTAT